MIKYPKCGTAPFQLVWTDIDLKYVLKELMASEKGAGVSDADRAYKRGWRDCIRHVRKMMDERRDAAPRGSKEGLCFGYTQRRN